jgi:NOL1/NOP2/fmu family ribosome biogenesis protein
MAKKNLKVDIDTEKVDLKIERKDGDLKVDYDGKNIDVTVDKTVDKVEVKVDSQGGLFKIVGNIVKKILLRRLK